MKKLDVIYENTVQMYSKLFIDLKGKEHLAQPKLISENIINEAFLTINYHTFFIKEKLYKITLGQALINTNVIRNNIFFLEDRLQQKAQLLKSKLHQVQQSAYLYMVTIQTSVLLSKAKLMLEFEKKSIAWTKNYCTTEGFG